MAATDAEGVASTIIKDCIATQQGLLERSSLHAIVDAAQLIADSLSGGGKLLLFGNGGSASDAAHIAAEFVGRFQRDRRALPALSLCAHRPAPRDWDHRPHRWGRGRPRRRG
jgi:phosphoheptose isomerase